MYISQFTVKFVDVVCCKFKRALNFSIQVIAWGSVKSSNGVKCKRSSPSYPQITAKPKDVLIIWR